MGQIKKDYYVLISILLTYVAKKIFIHKAHVF